MSSALNTTLSYLNIDTNRYHSWDYARYSEHDVAEAEHDQTDPRSQAQSYLWFRALILLASFLLLPFAVSAKGKPVVRWGRKVTGLEQDSRIARDICHYPLSFLKIAGLPEPGLVPLFPG
jgi:hypothetical protein